MVRFFRRAWNKKLLIVFAFISLAVAIYWFFCLPKNLFETKLSTHLLDKNGVLLAAKIADDGQWRFAPTDSVPHKFKTCIVTYEDRRFYNHLGFNPAAVARAAWQNFSTREVVSGASTITMQLMRMSRSPKPRNLFQKSVEIVWATRAEWRYSKDEILNLYVSNAPFGGNVVGLDAASWRYFNKPAYALSWAESAALAVLPNAPGMIYPGRNPAELLRKRNGLLKTLYDLNHLSKQEYNLALLEDLPAAPLPLPSTSNHLLALGVKKHPGTQIQTTIDQKIQNTAVEILERRLDHLRANRVHHGAILVANTETGEVLAYVGNGKQMGPNDGSANDMIQTPRSSGSILKPLLFGAMIEAGELTPRQLIPDIPTQYSGFAPRNYDDSYSGAVPAEEALARSLNIPAVRMLRDFGIPNFHKTLNHAGFTTITQSPSHYGLSLILGGAEVTIWDLANAYQMVGNILIRYPSKPVFTGITCFANKQDSLRSFPFQAGAAWATAEAMALVTRPDEQASWQVFGGSQKIAWKTGTSYGSRDAWAVGMTPKYTVAVWVGNADGEGRPGITGLSAAAPVLFDVFNALPQTNWFLPPSAELEQVEICAYSGMRASPNCGKQKTMAIPKKSLSTSGCVYCSFVHLSEDLSYRVHADCYPREKIQTSSQFILPALQAWFYRKYHADYFKMPPWLNGCSTENTQNKISMIYPRNESDVFIPRELDGVKEKIVLKAAHTQSNAVIYWHLNDIYLGSTTKFHEMEILVQSGEYKLYLIDDEGENYATTIKIETK